MASKNVTESRYAIGALLRKPYDHLVREVYGSIARDGHPELNPSHGRILRHISPSGSKTVDLARLAGMTKQSMAQLILDLEAHGYVCLQPHPTDGRAKLVKLTDKGVAVKEEIISRSKAIEEEWSKRLGKERWEATRQTLSDLFDILD